MSQHLMSRRIILYLAAITGLLVLTLGGWIAVAGPVAVLRIIRYGDTQIDDFTHYPSRRLIASDNPFQFIDGTASEHVLATIQLEQGVDVKLEEVLSSSDTIAFLIVQDDAILFEQYYQGHTRSSLSQSFSVSKSVTSALIGAAIADGYIESVDQRVTDFVPELADDGFSNVTIRNLLTMQSGSDYVENDNPFGIHVILNYTPNLRERILSFDVIDTPGVEWRYKSGDNALLALLLERALGGRTITDYTQTELWTPLGMEYDGLWTLDREEAGLEKTWCCLAVTARDFAKLGRLYLRRGRWEGHRVFSKEWAEQSTAAGAIPEAEWSADYANIGLWNYGYQWWLVSQEDGDYLASGKDGQYIYVNPAHDLIVVRLGWSSGDLALSDWIALFRYLSDSIEQ